MEQNLRKITEMLGGSKVLGSTPASDRDVVLIVRRGIPVESFSSAARYLRLTEDEARRSLGLPKRTLARRKAEKALLRPSESERVLRLVRAASLAEEVLGDREKALRWLTRPNTGLGGELPIQFLDTDVGADAVLRELRRFEHGVFS